MRSRSGISIVSGAAGWVLWCGLLLATLTSCGSPGGTRLATTTDNSSQFYSGPSRDSSGASPNPGVATPSPSPSPSPVPASTSDKPPVIIQEIHGVGYDTQTITVHTRTVLKVRLKPEINDRKVAGTGFTPNYAKIGAFVKVGTYEQPTHLMDSGYQSGRADDQSRIFDFSTSFTHCADTDLTCSQAVTITVYKVNTDARCVMFGVTCPYERQYDGYPYNLQLQVETDDTDTLK